MSQISSGISRAQETYTWASVSITYMQPPKSRHLKLKLISTLNMTPVLHVRLAQMGIGELPGKNLSP